MSKDTRTAPPPNRSAFLWLAVAAVFFLFAAGRLAIPLAAWLAPLFLLRFVRSQRPLRGLLLAWLVRYVVAIVALRGTVAVSGARYFLSVLLLIAVAMLPYLADRLMTPRLNGFVGTLVFPATFTALEYLSSFGPTGTINSIANTQYGNLPLMQVVSVTGIWGVTFLITWFAAVGNWAWEQRLAWPRVRTGATVYAAVLALVLLGGGARLALLRPDADQVRVAGLSASREAVTASTREMPAHTLTALQSGKATPSERTAARTAFATLDADLLARSGQEALAGSKIVVWPEASPVGASILQEDEPALIQQAGTLARQDRVYLDMGLAVFLPGAGSPPYLKDEAVLVDPSGHVVWTYEKSHLVPFTEQGLVVAGNGRMPLVGSPYGRLSNVICFDLDYPAMVRQAGRVGADLMLAPSDDWRGIDPAHAQAATVTAIENGFSLVRQASNGLSIAVDYEGHVLAASDYFTTDQQAMVAYLPVHGVHTIYAGIGDVFAWLCLIGLVALLALAIRPSRRRRSATSAPLQEPEPTEDPHRPARRLGCKAMPGDTGSVPGK